MGSLTFSANPRNNLNYSIALFCDGKHQDRYDRCGNQMNQTALNLI